MKIKVVTTFWDKNDNRICYNVGEVHDFEEGRAHSIVERGFGEYLEEVAKKCEEVAEAPKAEEPVVEAKEEVAEQDMFANDAKAENDGVAEDADAHKRGRKPIVKE